MDCDNDDNDWMHPPSYQTNTNYTDSSGRRIDELPRNETSAQIGNTSAPRITNVTPIASFNWLEGGDAHICVPGMPPRWSPPRQLPPLKPDNGGGGGGGVHYRDTNAVFHPSFPIEPAVQAILRMNPTPATATGDDRTIDVFGCASTLGNLLRFAKGSHPGFRMFMENIGGTVHLARCGGSPYEVITGGARGCGHGFRENYTTWDRSVRRSVSHQRVIQYRFSGMTCIVQFEGDGYLPDKADQEAYTTNDGGPTPGTESMEDLSSALTTSSSHPPKGSYAVLEVSNGARSVHQDALFDLAVQGRPGDEEATATLDAEMPRLWLCQVFTLILASHHHHHHHHHAGDRGGTLFDGDIGIHDARASVAAWEVANAGAIARFGEVLRALVDFARRSGDGARLEVRGRVGHDFLSFTELSGECMQAALSPGLAWRWKAWLEEGRGSACM